MVHENDAANVGARHPCAGQIESGLFQITLGVIGVATFSFVFASFYYYGSSLRTWLGEAERARYYRWGDRFWLLGHTLLFLDPSLILFTVGLVVVALLWLALWVAYLSFTIWSFRIYSASRGAPAPSKAA